MSGGGRVPGLCPPTLVSSTQPAAQARIYQRLPSRLAFLKLTAAEALPEVLDAARDRHLLTMKAIETLLGIQITATGQRQVESRLHFAKLPAP